MLESLGITTGRFASRIPLLPLVDSALTLSSVKSWPTRIMMSWLQLIRTVNLLVLLACMTIIRQVPNVLERGLVQILT